MYVRRYDTVVVSAAADRLSCRSASRFPVGLEFRSRERVRRQGGKQSGRWWRTPRFTETDRERAAVSTRAAGELRVVVVIVVSERGASADREIMTCQTTSGCSSCRSVASAGISRLTAAAAAMAVQET
jgi:hypothetical protein